MGGWLKSCVSKFWVAQNCARKFRVTILSRDPLTIPAPSSPLPVFFHMCLYYEHIISIGFEIKSIKAQRNFPSENLTELCLNLFSVCGSIGRKYSSVSIIFIIKQYLIMISFNSNIVSIVSNVGKYYCQQKRSNQCWNFIVNLEHQCHL